MNFQLLKKQPSQAVFAKIFADELARQGIHQNLKYDSKAFCLVDSGSVVINLARMYDMYCRSKRREHQTVLTKLAKVFFMPELPQNLQDALPRTVPTFHRLADLEMHELASQVDDTCSTKLRIGNDFQITQAVETQAEDNLLVSTPFVGDLAVTFSIRYATNALWLPRWFAKQSNVTAEELLPQAIMNLRDFNNDQFAEVAPGLHLLTSDHCDVSSCMLLTEMIYRLPLHGMPIAMLPTCNYLLVTGRNNVEGLAEMMRFAAKLLTATTTRIQSTCLFCLKDGIWHEFDAEVPIELHNVRRQIAAQDYARRQSLLNRTRPETLPREIRGSQCAGR